MDKSDDIDLKTCSTVTTNILILGSGFAGIEVLRRIQKKLKNSENIHITLVSKDNFFLFTPMLHEVSSGSIETRHIVTPIRSFCSKAKFYEESVKCIDLKAKEVLTSHIIGIPSSPYESHNRKFKYDYLVIALGSETNFDGMDDVKQSSFTMKNIDDAITLRNHILDILEQASREQDNKELRKSLLTFVIVGGGFGGVETVGGLNDFVRQSVREYYKNIYMTEIRIVLVSAEDKILSGIDEGLGEYALEKLRLNGVEFMVQTHANGAGKNYLELDNGTKIFCHTIVWTAGLTTKSLIKELPCKHDKSGRIQTNSYLEVEEFPGVYAVGDCASIPDPESGKPYPPTAQHAIREGRTAAKNILSEIKERKNGEVERIRTREKFSYTTKGVMANIGNKNGVAIIYGIKLQGFIAWFFWRTFYLSNLPTLKKKLKVMSDWTMDLIFKPDVAMIKTIAKYVIKEKGVGSK